MSKNQDNASVISFGDEWSRFDQSDLSVEEAKKIFDEYFAIFPWEKLPSNASGFDMGCGSGRWAKFVASRVGQLHCIDPSKALDVAKETLSSYTNVFFHQGSVDDCLLPPNSQDFGYSLGVLHHVPDTAGAIRACATMLKPGAPLLIYLYYAFDNRSYLFKQIWRCTNLLRLIICKLPSGLKHRVTFILALIVYYPCARLSLLLEKLGFNVESIPLSYYRNHSFYTMCTDSRDRFGTPLEKRFTCNEIITMMDSAELEHVYFSSQAPYWCVVGIKR